MIEVILGLMQVMADSVLKVVPATIALAVIFTVLNHFWTCNAGPPWWHKRELLTDIVYWFAIPLIARTARIGALIIGAALIFNVYGEKNLIAFFDNGHGPLSELPFWFQAILFLVLSDIPMYWLHRVFHGEALWRYHAIHHSSEDLDWISAARFHPVNIILGAVAVDVALLLAGISPKVMIWVAPFKIFHSAFVHANLNWTLGPLKYVIATPVFHRWHHTGLEDGGNTNFATTFPIWDILFGTFYMPKDRLPANYGAGDPALPDGFVSQTVYPFRQRTLEPAE
jgi:sterol desaturase/sphingolipid hydroxylase (fatty acid hydroxylase superfamily)